MNKKLFGIAASFLMALTPVADLVPYMDTAVYAETQKLSAPSNFRTTEVSGNYVRLKWSKVKGADAYRLYCYNTATKKTKSYIINGTSCKLKGLSGSTKYKFTVCALVKNGKKYTVQTKSDAITATTTVGAPTNIKTDMTDTSVTIKWTKAPDADEYEIFCYDPKTKEYVTTTKKTFTDTCTIFNLDPDTEYRFKVRSLKFGNSKYILGAFTDAIKVKTLKAPVQVDPYEGYDTVDTLTYFRLSPDGIGTASNVSGKTIIVSVFVDDANTSWDIKGSDENTVQRIWQNTRTVTGYIRENVRIRGKSAEIISDWNENPDLMIRASIDTDLQKIDNVYESVAKIINKNVPSIGLKSKYNADNIVYMVYLNAETGSTSSSTWCFDDPEMQYRYPYEFALIYKYENYPALMAQSILHMFGAPYLYKTGEFGITQEYVDNANFIDLNDIMRTYRDLKSGNIPNLDITNEVTEISAYYLGLIDSSYIVSKWGFEKSQHDK